MNLNLNSINAKVYRWFYSKNNMPTNLCPYFWKSVWMWMVILPYFLITLPHSVFTKFDNEEHSTRIAASFILYLFLTAAVSILVGISSFFVEYADQSFMWQVAMSGIAIAITVIVALSISFVIIQFRKLHQKHWNKKWDRMHSDEYVKTDNIIVGFVKAKYNKYCPQITWKN